jgi:hypothetical protein
MLRTIALLVASVAPLSAQQDPGHRFTVTPSASRAAVGDPVTLRFSVSLHERDLITDSVPRPAGELQEGIRLLAVRKLGRSGDRALAGEATVAFFRPGVQQLPAFEIPFLRVSANMRGTIRSEPGTVEIAPVAPPGNPALKDLKELAPVGGVDWLPIGAAGAAVVLAALVFRRWRRGRRRVAPLATPALPPAPARDPFESALARLAALDPADLPAAADIIRGCLADAASIPALERTTAELLSALPPHLVGNGNREQLSALLRDADLVKFAQARAPATAGSTFLDAARTLLTSWRAATTLPPRAADATG